MFLCKDGAVVTVGLHIKVLSPGISRPMLGRPAFAADTLVTDTGVPDCDLTCSCTDLIPRASISLMVEAGSKVEAGTVVEARTDVEAGTIVEARTVVQAGTTAVEVGTAEVGAIKVRDFKIRASQV